MLPCREYSIDHIGAGSWVSCVLGVVDPKTGVLAAPNAGVVAPPKRDAALCWPKAGATAEAPKREGLAVAPNAGVVVPKAGVEVAAVKLKGLAAAALLAPPKLKLLAILMPD